MQKVLVHSPIDICPIFVFISISFLVPGGGLSASDGQAKIQSEPGRIRLRCFDHLSGYHYDIPLHTYDFRWKLKELNLYIFDTSIFKQT